MLNLVAEEISGLLIGRHLGRIATSGANLLLDFGLRDRRLLLLSTDHRFPRIHLTQRKQKISQRTAEDAGIAAFALSLRKHLSGLRLTSVECANDDRIIFLGFGTEIEKQLFTLVGQFTGRSRNLFLLDSAGLIIAAAREQSHAGLIGSKYVPPQHLAGALTGEHTRSSIVIDSAGGVSAKLDSYFTKLIDEEELNRLANAARSAIRSKLQKVERLAGNLRSDLERHGDAEKWKHFGDLLLAAAASARRTPTGFVVTDYFDENLPEIEIPAEDGDSLTSAAEKYFRRYSKARNARRVLAERLAEAETEIKRLKSEAEEIESSIAAGDRDALSTYAAKPNKNLNKVFAAKSSKVVAAGCRRFISSDGFEILVGKKDSDNDFLTFRIAASRDIWLHAADYPGSHTVIRRGGKTEIPHRTLIEAAQIAAFYSKAREQTKVAVRYTERKNVHKRKGLSPGQVILSEFKTILVEPGIKVEAIR